MLVLSRKLGETIHVGDNIEVVVTEIQGSRVKLGIVAPRSVGIRRTELAGARPGPSNGDAANTVVQGRHR